MGLLKFPDLPQGKDNISWCHYSFFVHNVQYTIKNNRHVKKQTYMICKQKKKRRIYDSDTGEEDFNFHEHVKHNIRTKENINVKIQNFTRDFNFKNNKMNFMELKKCSV